MKKLIAFFEIPAADFRRAIDFYETVLNMKLPTCECEEEKMAFFTEGDEFVGAVSYASDCVHSCLQRLYIIFKGELFII